jgi:hypothetical protein
MTDRLLPLGPDHVEVMLPSTTAKLAKLGEELREISTFTAVNQNK